ncbi:Tetratricopeptide repeat protein [Pelomyxa schiedti]|nr:Tetratricopeptide repeat protein [Pelomyxa schiedti]
MAQRPTIRKEPTTLDEMWPLLDDLECLADNIDLVPGRSREAVQEAVQMLHKNSELLQQRPGAAADAPTEPEAAAATAETKPPSDAPRTSTSTSTGKEGKGGRGESAWQGFVGWDVRMGNTVLDACRRFKLLARDSDTFVANRIQLVAAAGSALKEYLCSKPEFCAELENLDPELSLELTSGATSMDTSTITELTYSFLDPDLQSLLLSWSQHSSSSLSLAAPAQSIDDFGLLALEHHRNLPLGSDSTPRVVKVFCSSTFRDFVSERNVLAKRVFPELQRIFQGQDISISFVDLRWGITEEETLGGDTIRVCLEQVERCKPYFLCMLGERYGWSRCTSGENSATLTKSFRQAEDCGFPWIQNTLDSSVTELEILHGALNDVTSAKHAGFFLRNKFGFVTKLSEEEQRIYAAESPEAEERLHSLKTRIISSGLPVYNYSDPTELGDLCIEFLKNAIEQDFPLDSEGNQNSERGEEARQAAFVKSHQCSYWTPRDEEFLFLDECIREEKSVIIYSPEGSGKSTLLCNWKVHAEKAFSDRDLFVIYHSCSTSFRSSIGSEVVRRVCTLIKKRYGITMAIPPNTQLTHDNIIAIFREIPSSSPVSVVVIIDSTDQLNTPNIELFPENLPNAVVFSVAAPGCIHYTPRKTNKTTVLHTMALFTEPQKQSFASNYLSYHSKRLDQQKLEILCKNARTGNPLHLKTVLDYLRIYGVFETLSAQLEECLSQDSLWKLMQLFLKQWEADYTVPTGVVKVILVHLVSSHSGLTDDEIVTIGNTTHALWFRFALALEPFLMNSASTNGIRRIKSEALKVAVSKRYLNDNDNNEKTEVHNSLATVLSRLYAPDHPRMMTEYGQLLGKLKNEQRAQEWVSNPRVFKKMLDDTTNITILRGICYQNYNVMTSLIEKVNSEADFTLLERVLSMLYEVFPARVTKYLSKSQVGVWVGAAKSVQDQYSCANILSLAAQSCSMCLNARARYSNCGYFRRSGDEMDEAVWYYQQALHVLDRIPIDERFPTHSTLESSVADNYAQLCIWDHQFDIGEELYNKSLQSKLRNHQGPTEIADTLSMLGGVFNNTGEYEKGILLRLKALNIYDSTIGPGDPKVAICLSKLAQLLFRMYETMTGKKGGDRVLEESLGLSANMVQAFAALVLKQAKGIAVRVYGPEHDLATGMAIIGKGPSWLDRNPPLPIGKSETDLRSW